MARGPLFAGILLSLAACSESTEPKMPPGIVVVVHSDMSELSVAEAITETEQGTAFSRLKFDISPADVPITAAQTVGDTSLVGMPFAFLVRRGRSDVLNLRLRGYSADPESGALPLLEQRIRARIPARETRVLGVHLNRVCATGPACPSDPRCYGEEQGTPANPAGSCGPVTAREPSPFTTLDEAIEATRPAPGDVDEPEVDSGSIEMPPMMTDDAGSPALDAAIMPPTLQDAGSIQDGGQDAAVELRHCDQGSCGIITSSARAWAFGDRLSGMRVTFPKPCTVVALGAYFDTESPSIYQTRNWQPTQVRFALYNQSQGGIPLQLLGETDTIHTVDAIPDGQGLAVAPTQGELTLPQRVSAGEYWIFFNSARALLVLGSSVQERWYLTPDDKPYPFGKFPDSPAAYTIPAGSMREGTLSFTASLYAVTIEEPATKGD